MLMSTPMSQVFGIDHAARALGRVDPEVPEDRAGGALVELVVGVVAVVAGDAEHALAGVKVFVPPRCDLGISFWFSTNAVLSTPSSGSSSTMSAGNL